MKKILIYLLCLSLVSLPVYAGMPAITLSDVTRLRFAGISFFAMLLLLVAFGIKYLWNYLRRDFARLPYLDYKKSLSLVILLGLLFNVVLLMISGTRELMTPGAWKKGEFVYQLKSKTEPNETQGKPARTGE